VERARRCGPAGRRRGTRRGDRLGVAALLLKASRKRGRGKRRRALGNTEAERWPRPLLATQLGFGGGVAIPGVRARNGTRGANRAGVGTDEDGSVMESYGRETMLSSAIADERAQGTESRTGPYNGGTSSFVREKERGRRLDPSVRASHARGKETRLLVLVLGRRRLLGLGWAPEEELRICGWSISIRVYIYVYTQPCLVVAAPIWRTSGIVGAHVLAMTYHSTMHDHDYVLLAAWLVPTCFT